MNTSLYAAVLGVLFIFLAIIVIRQRYKYRLASGDGGNFELQRRIRAHANFAEYAPLFLVLLLLAEMQGLPAWAVHALGVTFVAGRVLHAYSLIAAERYVDGKITTYPVWRTAGMVGTFTTMSILCVFLLIQRFLA